MGLPCFEEMDTVERPSLNRLLSLQLIEEFEIFLSLCSLCDNGRSQHASQKKGTSLQLVTENIKSYLRIVSFLNVINMLHCN